MANETLKEKRITVCWQIRDASGAVVDREILSGAEEAFQVRAAGAEVTVPPLSAVWLDKTVLETIDVFREYVGSQAWEGETCLSSGTVIFLLSEVLPV